VTREPLYKSEEEKVHLIGRNLLLQYHRVLQLADVSGNSLRLTTDVVRELHFLAIQDIYSCAGQFRTWPIRIIGSEHIPPEGKYVPGLVQDMCDEANKEKQDFVHTAAFLLWKLNWIHPFGGGNGRTSRAITQFALCVGLGFTPPGSPTLPQYIDGDRPRYTAALMDADAAWRENGVIDVSQMESLVNDLLKLQLSRPPRPVVARQEWIDPLILEPGRVIQSEGMPPLPPADS